MKYLLILLLFLVIEQNAYAVKVLKVKGQSLLVKLNPKESKALRPGKKIKLEKKDGGFTYAVVDKRYRKNKAKLDLQDGDVQIARGDRFKVVADQSEKSAEGLNSLASSSTVKSTAAVGVRAPFYLELGSSYRQYEHKRSKVEQDAYRVNTALFFDVSSVAPFVPVAFGAFVNFEMFNSPDNDDIYEWNQHVVDIGGAVSLTYRFGPVRPYLNLYESFFGFGSYTSKIDQKNGGIYTDISESGSIEPRERGLALGLAGYFGRIGVFVEGSTALGRKLVTKIDRKTTTQNGSDKSEMNNKTVKQDLYKVNGISLGVSLPIGG